jgi:hypothetical protein
MPTVIALAIALAGFVLVILLLVYASGGFG